MNSDVLTRRELIEQAVRALALPGGVVFFSAWLKAAQAHNHGGGVGLEALRDYKPRFFQADDFAALSAFTEILIPTDDTPGAREAHCAHFIDFVVVASDTPIQERWRGAMSSIKTAGFYEGDPEQRMKLVREMARPEVDRHARHAAYAAYRLIKQQTTFAFYTSRQGMIEALDYKGNSYNLVFPACNHPEHQTV